ncbi:MAG TPA: hypothetical protein VGO93_27010 [Candidatus Xenobia bacterium]|jgi:hypothetical protein
MVLLRPLGFGEMLDETLDLYRRNWLLLISIAAAAYLPFTLGAWAVGEPRQPNASHLDFWLYTFALMAVLELETAALVLAASNRYLGRRASLAGVYRHALRRWPLLLVLKTVTYIGIGLGSLLIVPGIALGFWCTFLTPVFMLEGTSMSQAWERARFLSAKEWGRIFGFYLLVTALVATFSLQPQAWTQLIKDQEMSWRVMQIWSTISTPLLHPVWALANMVLYYDIRIRKEAFDLQLQAEALAAVS